jgi:conjugal transfer pilus assembly protein TraV
MNTQRRHVVVLLLGLAGLVVTGCGNYKSKWGCKGYPEGSSCLPATEVYERRHEELVHMKDEGKENQEPSGMSSSRHAGSGGETGIAGQAEVQLGRPIVTPPEVLRVWIAPWRDGKNRLHEAALVYAIVKEADWKYGRKPKGPEEGSAMKAFAPFMSRQTVEPFNRSSNGAQAPTMPVDAPSRPAATLPSPAQDSSAILQQLQRQMPMVPTSPGGPFLPGVGAQDPDAQYQRQLEQFERNGP